MPDIAYRVVLTGDILEDFQHEEVVKATAELFKCSIDRARQTLNGKPSPMKKIMDHNTALNYQSRLRQIGIACRLEETQVVDANKPNLELESDKPANQAGRHNQSGVSNTNHSASGFNCPKCGTAQNRGDECISCGIIFSKYQTPIQPIPSANETTNGQEDMGELDELAVFVGDNTDKYRYQFHQLHHNDGKYHLQWHWPAFLIPIPWMIHRKLYIYAAAFAALLVLLPFYLVLPLSFAPGFLGYFLYYRHAQREIDKITTRGDQRNAAIAMTGGTNSMIVTIGSSILAGIVLSFLVYTLNVKPEMEQALGLAAEDMDQITKISNPGEKTTRVKMTLLKTTLLMQKKMKTAMGDGFAMPNNMNELQQTLALPPKADEDAWGTRLRFEMDGEALVFTSAGPDHNFGTDDDMVLRASE